MKVTHYEKIRLKGNYCWSIANAWTESGLGINSLESYDRGVRLKGLKMTVDSYTIKSKKDETPKALGDILKVYDFCGSRQQYEMLRKVGEDILSCDPHYSWKITTVTFKSSWIMLHVISEEIYLSWQKSKRPEKSLCNCGIILDANTLDNIHLTFTNANEKELNQYILNAQYTDNTTSLTEIHPETTKTWLLTSEKKKSGKVKEYIQGTGITNSANPKEKLEIAYEPCAVLF